MLQLNCMERLMINILKQGHIPEHISFIMDGNRRYAMSKNKQSYKGHQDGKQSLKTYLLYCLQLGIKQTSYFCFSIQNFKRSQIQVNKLMQLVLKTFDEVSQVSEFILRKNVKVKIIGKIQLFRQDVQQCLKKVEQKTKNNNKMVVNLCFAYDSIDEINNAILKAQKKNEDKIQQQISSQDDSDKNQINKKQKYSNVYDNLMITRPVDILVRTSNESRLSNYMLMQNGWSLICILKQNWPQINIFSLVKIILKYNMNYKQIEKRKVQWLKRFKQEKNKDTGIKNEHLKQSQKDKLL